MISRRTMIAGSIAMFAARRAAAQRVDWQGGSVDAALVTRIEGQLEMVRTLPIRADALAFFAAQPVAIIRDTGVGSFAYARGVFITRDPFPDDNPVLLHELLHRYHWQRLPQGRDNPDVLRFFDAARGVGRWPERSYMFTNPSEFFAMTASVVLHGRAARPPYTRAEVHDVLPDLERWIVDEFQLRD